MSIDEPLNPSGKVTRVPLENFCMLSGPSGNGSSNSSGHVPGGAPFSEKSVQELIQSTSDHFGEQRDLFKVLSSLAPEVFSSFSVATQRAIIGIGLNTEEYNGVQGKLEAATYDPEEQLQDHLLTILDRRSFFTARRFSIECAVSFTEATRDSLLHSVETVAESAPWRRREAIADLVALADPGSWLNLRDEQKEKLVAVSMSVEKIGKAHLVGTLLGLSDDSMRVATVHDCLNTGRIELAVQAGEYFGLPLKDEEIVQASERLKARQTQDSESGERDRVTSILDAYVANGKLEVASLPALAGERDPGLMSAIVLFKFRGRTLAHFGVAEGGHPGAFDSFRAYLARNGFAGEPTVLGGTFGFFPKNGKVTVQGASSTYGACDREYVGEVLRRALPEYSVAVRHDFPEIRRRN